MLIHNVQLKDPVQISKTCIDCQTTYSYLVEKADLAEYLTEGSRHIQHVFPYLSAEQRELLISGLCQNCFPF